MPLWNIAVDSYRVWGTGRDSLVQMGLASSSVLSCCSIAVAPHTQRCGICSSIPTRNPFAHLYTRSHYGLHSLPAAITGCNAIHIGSTCDITLGLLNKTVHWIFKRLQVYICESSIYFVFLNRNNRNKSQHNEISTTQWKRAATQQI